MWSRSTVQINFPKLITLWFLRNFQNYLMLQMHRIYFLNDNSTFLCNNNNKILPAINVYCNFLIIFFSLGICVCVCVWEKIWNDSIVLTHIDKNFSSHPHNDRPLAKLCCCRLHCNCWQLKYNTSASKFTIIDNLIWIFSIQ